MIWCVSRAVRRAERLHAVDTGGRGGDVVGRRDEDVSWRRPLSLAGAVDLERGGRVRVSHRRLCMEMGVCRGG